MRVGVGMGSRAWMWAWVRMLRVGMFLLRLSHRTPFIDAVAGVWLELASPEQTAARRFHCAGLLRRHAASRLMGALHAGSRGA